MNRNFEMLFDFVEELYKAVSDKVGLDYFDRMSLEDKLKELKKISTKIEA